jgi:hypothetical protein
MVEISRERPFGRIRAANGPGYVRDEDHRRATDLSYELCRMLTGLIKYLHRSDEKRRGTGRDWRTSD